MAGLFYNNTKLDGEFWEASDVESIETGFNKLEDHTPANLVNDIDNGTTAVAYVSTTDTQTLTNKTITTPTLTLKQAAGPVPTAEGDIQWDTDDNVLVIGNGSGQTTIPSTSSTSVLTNKTLTSPDINGATISGMTIDGSWTANGQTCADLGTVTTADINGGNIDGVTIGASSAAAGTFTTVTAKPSTAATGIQLGVLSNATTIP